MLNRSLVVFFLSFSSVFTGIPLEAKEKEKEVVVPSVVIGGGVGGGSAAIYLARAGFKPLVIQGAHPGGALVQSYSVENWPGELKIEGGELMERIRNQAEANGATYLDDEVISVDFSKRPFTLKTRSINNPKATKTIRAASCVIATGSAPNRLGVSGEDAYWGKGVSSCAICDGSLYRGKKVGVVGGGDSAVLEALYLANIAKEVTIFVRKGEFRAIDEQRKSVLRNLSNVRIFYHTTVEAIQGNQTELTQVELLREGKKVAYPLDGLFLAIGAKPNTELFQGKLDLDEQGYIALKQGQQTSVPYVYAIGDVADPLYKQAISAAGEGARAALALQAQLIEAPQLVALYHPQSVFEQNEPVVIEITSKEQFEREVKNAVTPILIDFYAKWCGPCKRIAPRLESSAAELSGKVKFLKIDVDLLEDLTHNYQIRSMPTVLYLDTQGKVVHRKVGETQIGELLRQLESD